jgi:hypothetical protein
MNEYGQLVQNDIKVILDDADEVCDLEITVLDHPTSD